MLECENKAHRVRITQGVKMLVYKRENLDGLDESLHSMYELKDGVYYLKVDGLPQQEDVSGLKAKLDELLGEKKKPSAKPMKQQQKQNELQRKQHAKMAT